MVVISRDPSPLEEAEACRISFQRTRKERTHAAFCSSVLFGLVTLRMRVCIRGCSDCVCSEFFSLTIIQRYWDSMFVL